jgi:phosphoribosylformylglycinamidine synthase
MKIAIIQFPGSNCESESMRAVKQAGMEPQEFLWNQNPNELQNFDGFFIVGGFSYEDRSRSGIISSLDPLMDYIKKENEKAKPILGICNGAQILVETGIVPGLKNYQTAMALAVNKRIKNGKILGTGFYNTWVNVQLAVFL